MATIIRPVSDDELPRACIIEAAAYGDNPLSPILFPGPQPPDAQQKKVTELIRLRKDDPTAVYMQAIDPASGRMIAFAKWHVYKTPEDTSIPNRKLEFGPGTNAEACMTLYESVMMRSKELMGGRPHIYLHMLHTDPDFQGRGAGGALMEWGKQKATELGVPIYLESSAKGYQFYLKKGFKEIEVFPVDLSKFGGPVHRQPLMIWEPVKAQ